MSRIFALFLLCGFSAPAFSSLLYGLWTGAPDALGITISWASAPPSPAVVEYGPAALFLATGELPFRLPYTPGAKEAQEIVHVRLEALEPSTWYAYRLVFPDGKETPIGTFRTAPEPGEPVSFGVIADTQWQWAEPTRVAVVAATMACDPWAFHFVLHGGDLVEPPIPSHWEFFFRSMAPVLRRSPLLLVLGNHERDSLSYYQHFVLPPGGGRLGKRWWALHWGDVIIVGLDSNAKKPQDYQEQVDWVRLNLSGPEPHKIVIFHHPVFSSDAHYGPGSEGLQKLWPPLFGELGVDLVFNGHAHNYERIVRDGVTYLVVGGGGANLYALSIQRVLGSQVGVENWYFYVAVRADAEGLQVRVIGVAQVQGGEVIPDLNVLDEFRLLRD